MSGRDLRRIARAERRYRNLRDKRRYHTVMSGRTRKGWK
jgi:hypothetical protein